MGCDGKWAEGCKPLRRLGDNARAFIRERRMDDAE